MTDIGFPFSSTSVPRMAGIGAQPPVRLVGVYGSGAEVSRRDGMQEGAQVEGALGPECRLELLLRLRPSLHPRPEESRTGLGQPQLLAPAIAAPFLDRDQ